jgi:hypothetical protein
LAASFFGILLALIAIWSLWRARVRPGWFMPTVAAALVVGTVVAGEHPDHKGAPKAAWSAAPH